MVKKRNTRLSWVVAPGRSGELGAANACRLKHMIAVKMNDLERWIDAIMTCQSDTNQPTSWYILSVSILSAAVKVKCYMRRVRCRCNWKKSAIDGTRSHPEIVGDMSRATLNFDLSKIPFVPCKFLVVTMKKLLKSVHIYQSYQYSGQYVALLLQANSTCRPADLLSQH